MPTANDLNISQPGYVAFDGTATFTGRTFQAGTGITISNPDGISGNSTISSTASLTDLHAARYIVSNGGASDGANYTTIAAAYAAAVATGTSQTVFIQPGTYTENITLSPTINLSAFICDSSSPNVIINGTLTATFSGAVSISGVNLQTNSVNVLTVSGSSSTVVNLINCTVNATNNSAISFSSSNGSSKIFMQSCTGNLATTGINLFSHSSSGTLEIFDCKFTNTGASTTANTVSSGIFNSWGSVFNNPLSISGTGSFGLRYCTIESNLQNVTALTANGSGTQGISHSFFASGTAPAITISTALTAVLCEVNSTNTNAVTGAGSLNNAGISFSGTSSLINTTTQAGRNIDIGGISFDGGTNVLSSYISNTYTPTVIGSTTAGTQSYSSQIGTYVRIGKIVLVGFSVQGTFGSTAAGVIQVSIPITASGTVTWWGPGILINSTTRTGMYQIGSGTLYATFADNTGAATTVTASNTFNVQGSIVYSV